jgi:glycosyltransferase involved in cell wall biosynthesis
MVNYEKIPAAAIQVIYNGIGLSDMYDKASAGDAAEVIRRENGLRCEDLLILSVGRMDPIKDFETLIRAFADITQQFSCAHLWIAGDGDPNYRRRLTDLVRRLGLNKKIKLLGVRRDINALLYACDLFVLPSVTEAASMTVLEAMTAARAVLATRTGGNPELVEHEKTGILVPVGNHAAMSEAIGLLLNDAELRRRMGAMGQAGVKEKFSREFTFAQYKDLYRSISQKKHWSPLRWVVKSPFVSRT